MALGQVGVFTTVLEALATTVGAGMLIGGFVMGAAGVMAGWRRPTLDTYALIAGYFGGIVGVMLALVDLALRYCG